MLAKRSLREKMQSSQAPRGEISDLDDLLPGDTKDISKQDGRCLAGKAVVKGQEKRADAEADREHHADGDLAAMQAIAEDAHHRAGQQGNGQHPVQGADAEQCGAGGPGEANVRQGMGRETDLANDHKIADYRRPGLRPESPRSGRSGQNRRKGNPLIDQS